MFDIINNNKITSENVFRNIVSRRILNTLYCLLLLAVLAGCSSVAADRHSPAFVTSDLTSANSSNTLAALNQQYQGWRAVPYKMGGLSKRGVDCSGFVYLTYRNQLGRQLPRTTESQYANSKKISKSDLQAGDLVFFKTGLKQLHVGIYLAEGQFLHASSSRGVMVSSLSNVYWQKNFLSARRI